VGAARLGRSAQLVGAAQLGQSAQLVGAAQLGRTYGTPAGWEKRSGDTTEETQRGQDRTREKHRGDKTGRGRNAEGTRQDKRETQRGKDSRWLGETQRGRVQAELLEGSAMIDQREKTGNNDLLGCRARVRAAKGSKGAPQAVRTSGTPAGWEKRSGDLSKGAGEHLLRFEILLGRARSRHGGVILLFCLL